MNEMNSKNKVNKSQNNNKSNFSLLIIEIKLK